MRELTLGQRISARRKLLNLSQEALAEQLGVSRQAVSKWEADGSIPEIDKLIALSKLFEVSMEWLLGVQTEQSNENEELNEKQLLMIEQIASRYQPVIKRSRLWTAGAWIMIFILLGLSCFYHFEANYISQESTNTQNILDSILKEYTDISNKVEQMGELIQIQNESEKLLSDIRLSNHADEHLENISFVLYMTPKVHIKGATAYLTIENPLTGYYERLECAWNISHYVLRHTMPIADGYQISFLLVNDFGYQEENLSLRDLGFDSLGLYSNFHLEYGSDQYLQILQNKAGNMDVSNKNYAFNEKIYTPFIFSKYAMGYKDIVISLKHNNTEIWKKSYKDEFRAASEGFNGLKNPSNPVMPNIEVELPEIFPGDVLELILTAETYNGGLEKTQSYTALLDRTVVSN